MKTKNGITLIALIITIIVMLILVGVTVTVAINGGLFEKAKEGAKGTEIGREKEELTSAITTAYNVETEKVDKTKLEEALLGSGWSVKGNEGGPYTVKSPNGNNYKITSNGSILEENTLAYIYCPKENCTNETHLHKGDYVEYKPTTVAQAYAPDKGEGIGKYTGYTKGDSEQSIPQENLNWRVLGQDDNGNILLISRAPTEAGLSFRGYVGYNNYETVLNDTCKALYSNIELGATARSIIMEDIYNYLDRRNIDHTTGSYQNENAITSKFKYNKEANTLTKEDCIIPAKDLTISAFTFYATSDLIGEKNREILLGKKALYKHGVAHRGASVLFNVAYWGFGYVEDGKVGAGRDLCDSNGNEYDASRCLRPVVTLPPSVTTDQVSKKDGQLPETLKDS